MQDVLVFKAVLATVAGIGIVVIIDISKNYSLL